ncbi:DUF456 domain-containing protein [Bacteroidia bacterium]|nr:DUF456 domain-containing protein [Bacteroidia bacterium]
MEIAVIILGILLIIIGFVGSILPALPGPPLAYGSLLLLLIHESTKTEMAENNFLWLIILGGFTLFITIIDYYMPIWGTKKFGGTKAGSRGSTLGLIVAVVLTFFTSGLAVILIIVGPFAGAYLGEKQSGQTSQVALQSAKGSFLGFIAGTLMKVITVTAIALYFAFVLL